MEHRNWKTAKSGAQIGLEKKMKYWDETAYNILVGQALNLAIEMGVRDADKIALETKALAEIILELRSDPEMRELYERYYPAPVPKSGYQPSFNQ